MTDASRTPLPDPATSPESKTRTDIGSVFVSNYPPYSFWSEAAVEQALGELDSPQPASRSLGLYLHIPFCRKRCKFCYFKVYTGKNSDEIQTYLDALGAELDTWGRMASVQGRELDFVYFGGGTPSFISVKHLTGLVERARAALPWRNPREVAFECEPGTLTRSKLEAIRAIGVTRLSLGVEHFDDRILETNGRAHVSKEIHRVRPWIAELDFPQLNIDLIAGMIGDTWDTWKATVQQAIDYDPDSVTIYQMELPHNAIYARDLREGQLDRTYVADWATKREWNQYAIDALRAAGFRSSSAYTMVKDDGRPQNFVYRDALWTGADMIATGVASFGHMNGVHFQNTGSWKDYLDQAASGRLPLNRAYVLPDEERLVREMILQMKLGHLSRAYFQVKFATDIIERFGEPFATLRSEGMLDWDGDTVRITPAGMLQVDGLLPAFYHSRYRHSRYT